MISFMAPSNFDPIADLPLELSQGIFQFLDTDNLVSFRRVSKRWNNILSAESFCKIICDARIDTNEQTHCETQCWNELFLNHASRRHALAYGRPWAKAVFSYEIDEVYPDATYNEGKVAWFQSDAIRVLDIYKGTTVGFGVDEPPEEVRLTKKYLVYPDGMYAER